MLGVTSGLRLLGLREMSGAADGVREKSPFATLGGLGLRSGVARL
jgi:hypothetical protein